jgi:hypothetical protein
MAWALAGGRVGWRRRRAWIIEVFSSAEMTNSSDPSRSPANRRWYKSSTTPALAAKSGARGKIHDRCRHGLRASSSSQRHTVLTLTCSTSPQAMASSRTSATLKRLNGTARRAGNSQAIALTSAMTAGGKGAADPTDSGQPAPPDPPGRTACATSTRCSARCPGARRSACSPHPARLQARPAPAAPPAALPCVGGPVPQAPGAPPR